MPVCDVLLQNYIGLSSDKKSYQNILHIYPSTRNSILHALVEMHVLVGDPKCYLPAPEIISFSPAFTKFNIGRSTP